MLHKNAKKGKNKWNSGFFWQFATPTVYGKLLVVEKKIIKQKMQGAGSFVAPLRRGKIIRALTLTVQNLFTTFTCLATV